MGFGKESNIKLDVHPYPNKTRYIHFNNIVVNYLNNYETPTERKGRNHNSQE